LSPREQFTRLKTLKQDLHTNTQLQYRFAAIALAVVLGIIALLLGFSLIGSLFGILALTSGIGNFLARSYGILSLIIPVFLVYASFILVDPRWKPAHIFLLGACIFPFLTLATGFTFIRDFEFRSQQFAFLDFAGKTGFSFIIVLITILEALLLYIIKNLLFRDNSDSDKSHTLNKYFLPAPESVPEGSQDQAADSAAEVFNDSADDAIVDAAADADAATDIPELLDEIDAAFVPDDPELPDMADTYSDSMDAVPAEEDAEIDADDFSEDEDEGDGVEKALEEAKAAASVYGEQVRKKAATTHKNLQKNIRSYKVPLDILNEYPDGEYWIIDRATEEAAKTLKQTLEEFKIQAEVTGIRKGPVITMFEILPAPGVKLSRIVNLQDNIALRLAASSVRIVAPIPGKHAVGIEVPNAKRNIVSFREIIEGVLQQEERKMEIPLVMGKDISGEALTIDLAQMPHLLIAGATGSGKSVCVNAMILSILYQRHPAECKLILIDPKIVELKLYNDIPHLLTPVITEPKKAFQALQYCIFEMERRYSCLDKMGVRDIRSYNKRIREKNVAQEHMPYIVVVIDEFADLMATTGKELESTVARLAAMSRAVGIHLVLATQRPSIDIITGLIKANIPSRIAFMVASKMDSRIIIDMVGAEKLLGRGDMLYAGAVDPFPVRIQGAFVSEEEVEAVVEYVKTLGKPDYIDDEIFYEEETDEANPSLFSDGDDPLYDKALEIVLQQGKASASFIQRRLKIGYNRSARLVEQMEQNGVVGPAQGSKPRDVLRAF